MSKRNVRRRLTHEQFFHIIEYLRTQADENGVLIKPVSQITREVSALLDFDVGEPSVTKAMDAAKLQPKALSGFASAAAFEELNARVNRIGAVVDMIAKEFDIKERKDGEGESADK